MPLVSCYRLSRIKDTDILVTGEAMTTSKENGVTNLSTLAVSVNDIKNRNTSSKVCRMLTPSEIKDLQQNKR